MKELEKLRNLQNQAKAIYNQAIQEDRDLTGEERDKLNVLFDEGKQASEVVEQKQRDQAMKAAIMDWNVGEPEQKSNGKKSLADQVLENPNFQEWFKSMAPSGSIPESAKGINSPAVNIKRTGLFKKDLVTGLSDTSAGAFINPEQSGIVERLGYSPTVARDLISVLTTNTDSVDYVEQTAKPSAAAPKAEAVTTASAGAAESAITYAKKVTAVESIAAWLPITKRALSDAGQMQGLINQDLLSDLNDKLENQIFNGNGTSPQLRGIANTVGILTGAYDTDLLITARKAITNLMVNGLDRPTAWVMNPTDWETYSLLKDGDNRYYFGGPLSGSQKVLWGVPVVESFHVAAGYSYLANWKRARLWDREQASISISDSHSDFFIKGILAILSELRAAFAITRPTSFVKVDLTAT